MAYVGAYYRKYKYPNSAVNPTGGGDSALYRPQYKVDGLEPDVADANLLDSEIADISSKLGAMAEIDTNWRNFTPEQHVYHDEIVGNRIQVVGSNDSASTVEPEVRRIFGEYQTAAFLDSLSDSDEDSEDSNDLNDIDDEPDYSITGGDNTVSLEKSYHGINYYEVDNTKQYDFATAVNAVDGAGDNVDEGLAQTSLVAFTVALGAHNDASDFDWSEVLDE
ncbi:hypothetical protein D5b_00046 [Faustovirus]|nr:hypothetical protein D5b_00046 [Faustovirus]AMN84863.1 hypothetical protein D6_00464 [Faustovirus]AMP44005.1 hypothetical protein PRJ_Dakar_00045 [Faustovirus]